MLEYGLRQFQNFYFHLGVTLQVRLFMVSQVHPSSISFYEISSGDILRLSHYHPSRNNSYTLDNTKDSTL